MTWLYLALFAPGLVGAGYILGWTVRGKQVDARLLAASERAEQVLRNRYYGEGYVAGVVVERRTGDLFRRTLKEVSNGPATLRNVGVL